jgi:hypothetical protein
MKSLKLKDKITLVKITETQYSNSTPRVEFLDSEVKDVNSLYAYIPERPTTPYYKKKREINTPLYGGTSFLLNRLNSREKDMIKMYSENFTTKRYNESYYIDNKKIKEFFKLNSLL